ncbi:S9 family peptidase [soil metagenome]
MRLRISRSIAALVLGCTLVSQALAGPAEAFARLDEIDDVLISPKGDKIALSIRGDDGVAALAIVQIEGMKPLGKVSITRGRDVHDFWWASGDRLLFGTAVHLGIGEAAYATRDLFVVNSDGTGLKLLLQPQQGMSYRDWSMVSARLPDDPDNILVRMPNPSDVYTSNPGQHLYKVDLMQGRLRRLTPAQASRGRFLVDHAGHVRFQTAVERDLTEVVLYRATDADDWKEIGRYPMNGKGSMTPIQVTSDNRDVFVAYDRQTKGHMTAIYRIDPDNPEPKLLYADPDHDVARLLGSRTVGSPAGVVVNGAKTEWRYFDPSSADAVLLESIRTTFKGKTVRLLNWSDDRSRVAIAVDSDVDPGSYYVLDLAKGKILTRLSAAPWIDPAAMAPTTPFEMKARDGLVLRGYLTVPKEGSRHKLVVMPHGGPFGLRDTWSYDPEAQWLARNGYSVLKINYRGSGGYGGDFIGAGYGQWGGAMQDDLTDATRWAISHGHADADKVCIFGASYGGYAALMGVVKEPDLYRCAIGYAGAYDLRRIKRSENRSAELFHDFTIGTDAEDLDRRSPALRATEIKVPVLLIHGGEDWVCPPDQYEVMRDALAAARKPFETLYKSNEGHGFVSPANREEAMVRIVKFLDANTSAN